MTIIIGFILVREREFNSTETSKLSPTLNVGLGYKGYRHIYEESNYFDIALPYVKASVQFPWNKVVFKGETSISSLSLSNVTSYTE